MTKKYLTYTSHRRIYFTKLFTREVSCSVMHDSYVISIAQKDSAYVVILYEKKVCHFCLDVKTHIVISTTVQVSSNANKLSLKTISAAR